MTDYEAFVHELIGYIFKVQDKDDDNLSAEIVCRKLYKYGLIKRDNHKWRMKYRPRYVWPARIRKTEPQIDDFFRELTAEERKAVAEYIESISIPTGVNVFDLMDEQTERSE